MAEGSIAGMAERQIMNEEALGRALSRIAHEVLERNRGAEDLLLVGIHRRGVPLAQRLSARVHEFEGASVPVGSLDINLYRDDLRERKRPRVRIQRTDLPVSIQGQRVVLVDDVLYTGRTIRAALDALVDYGRPMQVQLAVMIDRGHRELPIRADYVGRNIPTAREEIVAVRLDEIDGIEEVVLLRPDDSKADEHEPESREPESRESEAVAVGGE
jgi:pyrimidine operon attenuation protein/uracil phosphoribosyltransferase